MKSAEPPSVLSQLPSLEEIRDKLALHARESELLRDLARIVRRRLKYEQPEVQLSPPGKSA
jgi:hypothetical protein